MTHFIITIFHSIKMKIADVYTFTSLQLTKSTLTNELYAVLIFFKNRRVSASPEIPCFFTYEWRLAGMKKTSTQS